MKLPRDSGPFHAAINTRIAEVVKGLPSMPEWYDDWMQLAPETSEERRLAVYQAIRKSGVLPEDAGFFLVSWQADVIASQRAETELKGMEDRLREIEKQHGSEGLGDWPSGEAPAEYTQILSQYHPAWDKIFARTLAEFGEAEMASLFQTDEDAFGDRNDAGRDYFHGSPEPEWLSNLVEGVTSAVEADSVMGPLGVRFFEEDGFWEILMYPEPIELVGGAADGAVVLPGMSVDVRQIESLFDRVDAVHWDTNGFHGSEPPFLSVEGAFAGVELWLRFSAEAPDDEEPRLKLNLNRRRPSDAGDNS